MPQILLTMPRDSDWCIEKIGGGEMVGWVLPIKACCPFKPVVVHTICPAKHLDRSDMMWDATPWYPACFRARHDHIADSIKAVESDFTTELEIRFG